jgi:hypothetical protein
VVADVYAGDTDTPSALSEDTVLFVVVADADADVLLRVATQLRLGNVAPSGGALATRADGAVVMSFEIVGLADTTVDYIRRKIIQITTVHTVDVISVERRSSVAQ